MKGLSFAFLKTLKSRLSRRIVLWVFVSILIVEGIILVPAARNERQAHQQQISEMALLSMKTLAQFRTGDRTPARANSAEATQLLSDIRRSQTALSVPLLAATVYDLQRQRLTSFDEGSQSQQRYEVLLSAQQLDWPYTVALSYDAATINQSTYAFIGRIIGLVLLISAFVTTSTFWVLQQLIISPLQQIRRQLMIAMSAQSSGDLYLPQRRLKRGDRSEIDQLIDAFNQRTAQLEAQIGKTQQALSEVKTAQAQLVQSEKMSSLGQLVAGIAHEVNNPASFIAGNLYHLHDYFEAMLTLVQRNKTLLATEIEDADLELDFIAEDWEKLIRSMESGAERIQSIVLSLRTFSRLDESASKTVDVHSGLDSALLLLNSRLEGDADSATTPISVIKDYGDLPAIACFPSALNQVFLQILSNAIDAIRERLESPSNTVYQPQIEIHTAFSASEELVTICIQDNGTGMDAETQASAFDPFFTKKPVGQGTGMGLAVSYQTIVSQHKGTLTCHATLGQGSSFVINLPAHRLAS